MSDKDENEHGEITRRVQKAVEETTNGFFAQAERFLRMAKILISVFVFVAGLGYGFSLWMNNVAHKEDIETVKKQQTEDREATRKQQAAIMEKLEKISGELEVLKQRYRRGGNE